MDGCKRKKRELDECQLMQPKKERELMSKERAKQKGQEHRKDRAALHCNHKRANPPTSAPGLSVLPCVAADTHTTHAPTTSKSAEIDSSPLLRPAMIPLPGFAFLSCLLPSPSPISLSLLTLPFFSSSRGRHRRSSFIVQRS
jgi:predicted Fe-S protein YdhL (DUF1289 family)